MDQIGMYDGLASPDTTMAPYGAKFNKINVAVPYYERIMRTNHIVPWENQNAEKLYMNRSKEFNEPPVLDYAQLSLSYDNPVDYEQLAPDDSNIVISDDPYNPQTNPYSSYSKQSNQQTSPYASYSKQSNPQSSLHPKNENIDSPIWSEYNKSMFHESNDLNICILLFIIFLLFLFFKSSGK